MFFSSEPKIKRIAKHLQSQLVEYCQSRWAYYLMVLENTGAGRESSEVRKSLQTPSWFRKKEDFSWRFLLSQNDELSLYVYDNALKQKVYYKDLLEEATVIVSELEQPQPNYVSIINSVSKIKNMSVNVPCVISGDDIQIKIDNFSGENLPVGFLMGLGGLFYAPAMCMASVLLIPFYCAEKSYYCGGPAFFLDTAKYFCDSLCKVISSIIFPLAMLRSKYVTDSYNPFCQGQLMRSLEAINSLAEQAQTGTDDALITALN